MMRPFLGSIVYSLRGKLLVWREYAAFQNDEKLLYQKVYAAYSPEVLPRAGLRFPSLDKLGQVVNTGSVLGEWVGLKRERVGKGWGIHEVRVKDRGSRRLPSTTRRVRREHDDT